MARREVRYRLTLDARDFQKKLKASTGQARNFSGTLKGLLGGAAALGALSVLARGARQVGEALETSARAAISWESAFAGVRKTVDASEAELRGIERGLLDLSKRLPETAIGLASVAEAAGQLGIQAPKITKFTEVVTGVGIATDVMARDAAVGFARLDNILTHGRGQFEETGSALVDLGNNSAATESEILDLALGFAPVAEQMRLTRGETLGFSAAIRSVGIESQAGASAISRSFIEMAQAVASGGDKLELFASLAGVSVAQFSDLFRRDASAAMLQFLAGLDQVADSGGNVFSTLDKLGLSEIRVRKTVLALAAGHEQAAASVRRGNEAFEANVALAEEVAKRNATTASAFQRLENGVFDLARAVGERLLPTLGKAADLFGKLAENATRAAEGGVGDFLEGVLGGGTDELKEMTRNLAVLVNLMERLNSARKSTQGVLGIPDVSVGGGLAGSIAGGAATRGAVGSLPGGGTIQQVMDLLGLGRGIAAETRASFGPEGGPGATGLAGAGLGFTDSLGEQLDEIMTEALRVNAEKIKNTPPPPPAPTLFDKLRESQQRIEQSMVDRAIEDVAQVLSGGQNQLALPGLATVTERTGAFIDPALLETDFGEDAMIGAALAAESLSQNVSGAFDEVTKLDRATSNLSQAFEDLPNTILSAITGGGDVGRAVGASLGGAFGKDLEKPVTDALSGVLGKTLGGALGSVLPGLGSLLGSQLGGLIGGLIGGKSEAEKAAETVGREMGVTISDALAEQLAKDSERLGGTFEAMLVNLPAIIAESGRDARTFTSDIIDAFNAVELGVIPAAEGIAAIGGAFTQVLEAAQAAGSVGDQALLDVLSRSRELGIEIPEIAAFISEQLAGAMEGAGKISGIQLTDEQSALDQATVFSSVFWAAVKEQGIVGASDAMRESFAAIEESIGGAGFDASAILGPIGDLMNLTAEGGLFRDAASGAEGLNQALMGLANTGHLTSDSFVAIQNQALAAFDQMVAGGATSEQAIGALQPLLQSLVSTSDNYGLELSQAGQELLGMAAASGAAFSSEPQMRMVNALEQIVTLLGGTVEATDRFGETAGGAFGEMAAQGRAGADELQAALDQLNQQRVVIPVEFVTVNSPPSAPSGEVEIPGLAHGGMVHARPPSGRIVRLAEREDEFAVPESQADDFARDRLGGRGGGMDAEMRAMLAALPRTISRAVRDGLLQAQ